ncbi:putative nucleotide-binding protein [Paraburkholderia sp. HC6.4b]|uniref:TIR domain-containing protein n=1 Tax=unclassified Paraburkholderia TaxID=2615204 RepID=UPI00160B0D91|nr:MULTISPECIES: nucleotide-binding protein [unclassified Paraburkholderia]MBB5408589.1 putative nucleotide-binding protein [Paraburkholderia sp. HC6.4b]MBB5450421.1 putative nucleotide-binding protein [Paraburkholderia sp. Kb1A]
MASVATTMAKLAGLKKAIDRTLTDSGSHKVPIRIFSPDDVEAYFVGVANAVEELREALPDLYGDFPDVKEAPECAMTSGSDGQSRPNWYYRRQLERLSRNVDQVIEIRSNSELAAPATAAPRRVFISHGRAKDWYEVQSFIERDLKLATLELAQEPNKGLTVLGKLEEAANQCDSAVIVMTGDDKDESGQLRARENVMHEIGYFQGKYGLARVVVLHEEGVNIPSNIQGLVYIPFPQGFIEAAKAVLMRELNTIYG